MSLTKVVKCCVFTIHVIAINILVIKPTRCTNFSNLFFGIEFYMFRTVPLSIIRSFSPYTQQWYMSYRSADSYDQLRAGSVRNYSFVLILLASCQHNLYDIYHCCVYSEKLQMTDRGTVRNI